MSLLGWLKRASEREADALRLRKLLRDIAKKEGPDGDPFLELGPNKVLRRKEFTPLGPDHYEETWEPIDTAVKDGSPFGFFRLSANADGKHGAMMDGAMLHTSHQGKGLGKKAYQKLADHYGGVHSSDHETSPAAWRVYKALGAKPMRERYRNTSGELLQMIEGRDKGPRWGIFEE